MMKRAVILLTILMVACTGGPPEQPGPGPGTGQNETDAPPVQTNNTTVLPEPEEPTLEDIIASMNVSVDSVAEVAGEFWLIYGKSLTEEAGVSYIVVSGFTQEIEHGTEVHKKRVVWVRVPDGEATKVTNISVETTTEECVFICRHECGVDIKQACISSCRNSFSHVCKGNASIYCYPYCENKTAQDCDAPCLTEVSTNCEVSCSAGSPPQSVYESCYDECIEREHRLCVFDCADDNSPLCIDNCEADFKAGCIADAYPTCEPICESKENYVSCLADCESTC